MLFRSAILLVFFSGACAIFAQAPQKTPSSPSSKPAAASADITLRFASETPKKIWIADQLPSGDPEKSTTTKATEVVIPYKDQKAGDMVFVLELTTGNFAVRPAKSLTSPWEVRPEDYRFIFRVRVRIEHEGQPVADAHVSLASGDRKQEQLITSRDIGMTTFYAVKPGPVKLEVKYKTGEKTKSLPTQTVDLGLKRDSLEPSLVAVIDDDVAIADSPFPRKMRFSLPRSTRAPQPAPSPIGTFVVYAGGIVLALGLLYGLLKIIQKNPDKISAQLAKVGVQLPDPNADSSSSDDAIQPPKQPEPIQQIILGDAQVAPAVAQAAPVLGVPRLVSESGSVLDLVEGTSSVGRDDTASLSLPSETTVSRKHAEIVRSEDSILVRDLGSTNGTFVNGVQVQGESPLMPGDVVQFGAVRFRYEA